MQQQKKEIRLKHFEQKWQYQDDAQNWRNNFRSSDKRLVLKNIAEKRITYNSENPSKRWAKDLTGLLSKGGLQMFECTKKDAQNH